MGWKLFRPVGVEWHNEGYWKIAGLYNNAPETILQYLDLRDREDRPYLPPYAGYPLNDILKQNEDYYVMKASPLNHNALTLEQFKKVQPDIVIASIPQHFESFQKLINDFAPQAKLICHFGNVLWYLKDFPEIKNVMASIAPQPVPEGVNAVFYHQEFDTNIYKPRKDYAPGSQSRAIRSFVHTLSVADLFKDDWQTFLELEKALPDYKFESYGSACREGVISGHENIARLMQTSKFGLQLKKNGDGYGFVAHQLFACGIPPIVKMSQYIDKLAGDLMTDGETCINIDGLTPQESADKIRQFAEPSMYARLCEGAYRTFGEVVSFEKEEISIRDFLSKLK